MSPHEVFSAVRAEFDEEVAVRVLAIHCVQLTLKPKVDDLKEKGRFAARMRQRARKYLWRETGEQFEAAYSVAMALYDYEVGRSLGGLGGCKAQSLRELLARNAQQQEASHG